MSLLALLLLARTATAAEPVELTLDQALDRLVERNTTIAQARARTLEAQGVVRMASAAIQPVVAAQGSYTRNSHSAEMSISALFDGIESAINELVPTQVTLDRSGVPDDLIIQPLEQWMGGASVQVPLIVASSWADLAAARQAASAADAADDAVVLQVQSALVQACWMAAAAESYVDAAGMAVDTAQAHRESANRQLEAGVVTRLDVLRADTEVASRQSELAQARAELDKARLAVGVLVGEGGPVRVIMPEHAAILDAEPAALVDRGLVDRGLADRPEVAAREAAVEASRKQLQSAHLRHVPTLGASFSTFASDVAYPTGETWGWRAGINLTWVLYDGGFRYGKARQAEGAMAGAAAALDEQEDKVALEVQQALRDLDAARERMDLAETRLTLAEEASETAARGYEAGLVDSLRVLDAEDALRMARVAEVEARARLGVAGTKLQAATGEGW